MTYKFLFLEESGNGADFIMAVEPRPGLWQRLMGRAPEELEFFGLPAHWTTMDGMPAGPRVEGVLDQFWHEHRPAHFEHAGAAAWKDVEPNAS